MSMSAASPGAIVISAKTTIDTPSKVGTAYRSLRRAYRHIGPATPSLHHLDQGEVLEPALRVGEAFHLLRHRARVAVVHDPEPRRLVNELLVRLTRLLLDLLGVVGALDPEQRAVEDLVLPVPPVGPVGREVGAEEPGGHP